MDQMPTRKLTIVAQDPGVKVNGRILTTKVEIPSEVLDAGPGGYRVKIIDYDVSTNTLFKPWKPKPGLKGAQLDPYMNLEDKVILGNPRFHAQNVYAIVMRILALFESALGRRVSWSFRGHRLHIAPHAFSEANAFYSKRDRALLFGYFPTRDGLSTVFTCLSHDVIAHETVHALVDGLRECYTDPSTPDQAAFHEGFADAVALLSMFGLEDVVDKVLSSRAMKKLVKSKNIPLSALSKSALLGLAEQVGEELSGIRGMPLRRSIDVHKNKNNLKLPAYSEPHRRGEVFVAAVLHAFLEVWRQRVRPLSLESSATRDRVIEEGAEAAANLMTILIRALDYTPPTELTFGDFLSALLTADREMFPDDSKYHYRKVLLSSFRSFGINPKSRGNRAEPGIWLPEKRDELSYDRIHFEFLQRDPDEVFRFLWENRRKLGIHEEAYTEVLSVLPCQRVSVDGFVLRETVAQYFQMLTLKKAELRSFGIKEIPEEIEADQDITIYGGGSLIFDQRGRLKWHVHKRIHDGKRQQERLFYLVKNGLLDQDSTQRRFAEMHRRRMLAIPLAGI